MRKTYRKQRGMALILALAAILIVSMLVAGVMTVSVSHFALSHNNSNYAKALNVAEAGVNWKLHDMTVNGGPSAGASTQAIDATCSFSVHLENYPTGGPWVAPNTAWVVSTGTVNEAGQTWSRTVRVVAKGAGVFGTYALFGIDTGPNSLTIGGSLTVNGATGTNGTITVNGNPTLDGTFTYCGPTAGGEQPNAQETLYQAVPEQYPTVDQIANQLSKTTQGISYYKTHNNNSILVDSKGKPLITGPGYALDKNAFSSSATPGLITLTAGDYYLEGLDNQTGSLKIDDSAGYVNIWLGPAAGTGKTDTLNGNGLTFTTEDYNRFHLYDGSTRTLKMNGTMTFYGHIFDYNGPDSSGKYYGNVILEGNGTITGSIMGYDVQKTTGSGTITFPSVGGGSVDPGEPYLYWGFGSGWEEVNPA